MADNLEDRAILAGRVEQSQSEVASIRKQPLSPALVKVLSHAAKESGVAVHVVSGGQPGKGSGGPRTGSTRHDHGNAADINLFAANPDGSRRLLDFTDKGDLPTFKKFVSSAAAAGATGIGAGVNYMGPSTLHVGFGREATWGGAKWLSSAYREGRANPVDVAGNDTANSSKIAERIGSRVGGGEGGLQSLASDRTKFTGELQDPAIKARLFSLTAREVGSQGPEAQQAFMESVFNRASARGQTLDQTMQRGYYPAKSMKQVPGADYHQQLDATMGGSNVSKFATGNASGSVGFGGGPQTFKSRGERFGIEGHGKDIAWAEKMRSGPQTAAGRPAGPKPGSSEYWAQGKAKKDEQPQVAAKDDKPAPVEKRGITEYANLSKGKDAAPAQEQTAERAEPKGKGDGRKEVAEGYGKGGEARRAPETDRKGTPVQRGQDTGPSGYGAPPSSRPAPITTSMPEAMQVADTAPQPPPLPNAVTIHVYSRRV